MGKKSKQPSQPVRSEIPFTPPSYNMQPFGRIDYSGGVYTYTPSEAEMTGMTTRQRLINSLLPEVGLTSPERSKQIEETGATFTKRLMDEAMPYYKGIYASRGLQGSKGEASGLAKLAAEASQRGILAREDLFSQDEATKRANLAALERGLQEAYQRGSGIASQEGKYADQYFDIAKKNSDIQWANQIAAYNQAMQNYMDKLGAWQDIGGAGGAILGSYFGMPDLGLAIGRAGGGYIAGGKQGLYKSLAPKTGASNTRWA